MADDSLFVLANGKIPPEVLGPLLALLPSAGALIPPALGVDACAVDLGTTQICIKADPITMARGEAGKYVVSVNANDVACMGCRPLWFTSSILLPEGTTRGQLRAIWLDIIADLQRLGIGAAGGHTEVTPAVRWPVVSGQMIGTPISGAFLDARACQPGDVVLMWGCAGLEGTAIIAQAMLAARQAGRVLPTDLQDVELAAMANFIVDPGICIWPFVSQLLPHPGVVAVHDPTEGGVATALHELADASGCGVIASYASIEVHPLTARLCAAVGIDVLGLLSSGTALIVCRPEAVPALEYRFGGVLAHIATLTPPDQGRVLLCAPSSPTPAAAPAAAAAAPAPAAVSALPQAMARPTGMKDVRVGSPLAARRLMSGVRPGFSPQLARRMSGVLASATMSGVIEASGMSGVLTGPDPASSSVPEESLAYAYAPLPRYDTDQVVGVLRVIEG